MSRTVKVTFPGGEVREIEPTAWQADRGLGPTSPIFDIPGYVVHATIDGKYHASRWPE